MTGMDLVESVWRFLCENIEQFLNKETYEDFSGEIRQYEKDPNDTGEYIVVNHLPMVRHDVVSEATINVNVHVPALSTEKMPLRRLKELTSEIMSLFIGETFIDGCYYRAYSDGRPIEDNDNTWYVNIQLKTRFNNLIY